MFAVDRSNDTGQAARVAIYLRSYPFDVTGMECQRRALEDLAFEAGLPEPVTFLDNGLRVADGLPARDALLRAVAAGLVDTLLVPGTYVFGLGATGRQLDQPAAVPCELVGHRPRLV
ncbi:hypothetical protein ACWC5I_41025, partial [Kitasatospora sp. NPDC001574]